MFKKLFLFSLAFLLSTSILYAGGSPGLKVRESALEIATGNITGYFPIDKFGRNTEIDQDVTADIWDGGNTGDVSLIWVAPTQARSHTIVSTSTGDDGDPGGTGTRTLRVYGLPDWDTAEVNEDITMNGTSNVSTVNSYVIINRMEVLTKGSSPLGPNVGDITATAATDGTITSKIGVGIGQTQQTILGIPSTQKLYLWCLYADVNKAGGATGVIDVSLLVNPEPDTELINFLHKGTFGLQTVGSSHFVHPYCVPKEIIGPAIVKLHSHSGTNNMDMSGGYNGVLINNSRLP